MEPRQSIEANGNRGKLNHYNEGLSGDNLCCDQECPVLVTESGTRLLPKDHSLIVGISVAEFRARANLPPGEAFCKITETAECRDTEQMVPKYVNGRKAYNGAVTIKRRREAIEIEIRRNCEKCLYNLFEKTMEE